MPRKKTVTRRRKAVRSPKFPHEFFGQRKLTGAFTVVRIDDYSVVPENGPNGEFYRPLTLDEKRGNSIWPTREQAEHAARWAVGKWPRRVYGVYAMIAIVQAKEVEPVTKTTVL